MATRSVRNCWFSNQHRPANFVLTYFEMVTFSWLMMGHLCLYQEEMFVILHLEHVLVDIYSLRRYILFRLCYLCRFTFTVSACVGVKNGFRKQF